MSFRTISYEEVEKFIDPIKLNINFSVRDVGYFFKDNYKISDDIKQVIMYEYDNVINEIFKNSNYSIDDLYTISFTPHKNGYDLRLHPVDFVNNIFKIFNYNKQIPFIDLDDKYGFDSFSDYLDQTILPLINSDINEVDIFEAIIKNKKSILNLYNFKINDIFKTNLDKIFQAKDLLFYLSKISLQKYIRTNDVRYTLLPYEYYNKISDMLTTAYPHKIGNYWYNNFRLEYESALGIDYKPNIERFRLGINDFIIGLEILRPGQVDYQIKNVVQKVRSNPNVDYDKYRELFERKMNFYNSSKYKNRLFGKYGLNGYMGLVYPNEYLVFDKLYNSETIDKSKKTILTHGEAIYALPSDRLNIVTKTKQHIIEEKEKDTRIKKINHTDTFIERLGLVITGPNVSYNTFEEEIDKNKDKMFILVR